jgi:hypothetical protein
MRTLASAIEAYKVDHGTPPIPMRFQWSPDLAWWSGEAGSVTTPVAYLAGNLDSPFKTVEVFDAVADTRPRSEDYSHRLSAAALSPSTTATALP